MRSSDLSDNRSAGTGYFIIGANGQLGKALQTRFPDAVAADIDKLDIAKPKSVASFDWSGVKVILNAAAYTNVDGAETPQGRVAAWKVNASAVANLANIAREKDMTLVHISTDYVFDGKTNPHPEDEPFSPLSIYGASKAAGDIAASLTPKHYILRTSWLIGEGNNFVRTMLDLGKKGVNPTVVADQIGRLTFTTTLVDAISHLLSAGSSSLQPTGAPAPYGTYNVSNDGEPASWAEITRAIFKEAGLDNIVTGTTTEKYYEGKQGIAPRPLQSTLDLAKIKTAGFNPQDWHDDLREYILKELGR